MDVGSTGKCEFQMLGYLAHQSFCSFQQVRQHTGRIFAI